jgi:hypothetical protein
MADVSLAVKGRPDSAKVFDLEGEANLVVRVGLTDLECRNFIHLRSVPHRLQRHSLAALWHEPNGVGYESVNGIAQTVQSKQCVSEIVAIMRGQKAGNILKHDHRRAAASHLGQNFNEAPKSR